MISSTPSEGRNVRLSKQFEKALLYATRIHGGQLRKKTRIPYIAHILGVTAIALEFGANFFCDARSREEADAVSFFSVATA